MAKNITPKDPNRSTEDHGGGLRARIGRLVRAVGRRTGAMVKFSDRNIKDHVVPVAW